MQPRDTSGFKTIHQTLGPLFLLLVCPPFAQLVFYTHTHHQGSLASAFAEGPALLQHAWLDHVFGSAYAWALLAAFVSLQLLLVRLVPGRR